MSDDRAEFSVVEFYTDGTHRYVVRFIEGKPAVVIAKFLADHPSDDLERVIITDGGDYTVFEWTKGEGVTFK